MLFNRITFIACCIIMSLNGFSQNKEIDLKFGNITPKDFDVSSYKFIDADAAAVILYEAGSTRFEGNKKAWFNHVFTCTKRIKIINKRAFDDLANIRIFLYSKDGNPEVLSNVKAVTYNLDNNTVSSFSIDKSDIFSEAVNKNYTLKKFTLPSVQEGSIIEYTYTITSPYNFNIPSWQFQDKEYPKVWSEYKISIPATLTYASILQGNDSFYISKSSQGYESYQLTRLGDPNLGTHDENFTVSTVTNNHRWVKKDIKPLKVESYISSPENYIDKIEFQLSGTYNGQDKSTVWNTWENVCKEFSEEDDFQRAASGNNQWIKDLPEFTSGESDVDVAKKIYHYLQNNFTCTDENIFKQTDLYDVYKKQRGSVRAINLLLTAMLKNKGIYAEPVMLSTRENGFIYSNYPVASKLNYLICRANVGGKKYLLDATDPVLGFGNLPVKCYNGYARVINTARPDSLYLLADSLTESEISTLSLGSDANAKISGTYKCIMGQMQSADTRKKMLITNINDYSKNIKKDFTLDVNITNVSLDSLKQKEMPLSVNYDVDFKFEDDIIYFNPIVSNNIQKENPFKAAQRSLPVEMPSCINKTYILNMQVPEGYKVDELPKAARVSLNDNEGMFEYLIQQSGDRIQLRCRTKLNKATFEPEDYETLRNFFAFIVEKENEQIVFKKM